MSSTSYRDKVFRVDNRDARIRSSDDLMQFERYRPGDTLPRGKKAGDFKVIPVGTLVGVSAVQIVNRIVFSLARSAGPPAVEWGWTSTRNFAGKFINETLGEVAAKDGDDEKGPNAAWENGHFLGQKTLVSIVDFNLEIEHIALETLPRYQELVAQAGKAGVVLALRDGFRTFGDQAGLFEGFQHGKPGFNTAARPGFSKHQNGVAFDLVVGGGRGDPVYDWLAAHAPGLGFIRTVNGEPWHWEFRPEEAAAAAARGEHTLPGVVN